MTSNHILLCDICKVDRWQIDAIYSGTQKCLSCPPGLAPVSFNQRAMDVILNRKTKVQSWYLDVTMLANYWGSDRVYPHTAPINMSYALYEALQVIFEEGLDACFQRHQRGALRIQLCAVFHLDISSRQDRQEPASAMDIRLHNDVQSGGQRHTVANDSVLNGQRTIGG